MRPNVSMKKARVGYNDSGTGLIIGFAAWDFSRWHAENSNRVIRKERRERIKDCQICRKRMILREKIEIWRERLPSPIMGKDKLLLQLTTCDRFRSTTDHPLHSWGLWGFCLTWRLKPFFQTLKFFFFFSSARGLMFWL